MNTPSPPLSPVLRDLSLGLDAAVAGDQDLAGHSAPNNSISCEPAIQAASDTTEQQLTTVLNSYKEYCAWVPLKMSVIPRKILGRLARIREKPRIIPGWAKHLEGHKEVQQYHWQLVELLKRRPLNPGISLRDLWSLPNCSFKTWADRLVEEGFPQASDLYKSIEKNDSAFAAGYKFQLYRAMLAFCQYRLIAIEPQYGKPNPSTGLSMRGDAKLIESFSQADATGYYSPSQEEHRIIIEEDKVGYRDENKTGDALWNAFSHYAGIRDAGGNLYGGLENTQSTPPALEYRFPSNIPDWIIRELPVKAAAARMENPNAFPGGLSLGDKLLLPPLEGSRNKRRKIKDSISEPDADRSRLVIKQVQDILSDKDIFTQIDFIDWADWKDDFDSWIEHILDATNGYVTRQELSL